MDGVTIDALLARAAQAEHWVDVVQLARDAGCRIRKDSLPKHIDGFLYWGRKWPVIVINTNEHSPEEQRETVAHELYHLCRRAEGLTFRLRRRYDVRQDVEEDDAEGFAHRLLLPERLVWKMWPLCGTVQSMAQRLGAPVRSTALRLFELGLLELSPYPAT